MPVVHTEHIEVDKPGCLPPSPTRTHVKRFGKNQRNLGLREELLFNGRVYLFLAAQESQRFRNSPPQIGPQYSTVKINVKINVKMKSEYGTK
jgi:hypothetical protein